ncbi:MAG: hypothetical protein AAF581_22245 [Planctomycetota bacterium]
MRRLVLALLCVGLVSSVGCVGVRMSEQDATVHAECFRIFGFAIPKDDQTEARRVWEDKCGDYVETTTYSTAADWTSVCGVLGNIMGFHHTVISGNK